MAVIKKKGFPYAFVEEACLNCKGLCCRGESGYIFLKKTEVSQICRFLNQEEEEFLKRFTVKIGYRLSLCEYAIGTEFFCCFFDRDENRCGIYPARPAQCRDFPFWDRFLLHQDQDLWRCPGIVREE
ncbi:MAG: YkgJ family cysteine cluster protein [Candidatus Wallbacteria bacterium]|nr:YkgJ family cysteine cluster protein [Candidatus Wallbacteria bacterium]